MGFNGCRITSLTSIESGEAFNGAPLSVCQHSERGQHQSSLCSAGHRCQRHLEPMAATNRVYRDGDDGPGPRRPTHHSPGFYQRNHRCFQRVFVTLASSLLIPDLTSDPVGIKENQNGQKMALSYDWHWKIIGRRQRAPHCHYSRNGINKIWTVAMVTPPPPPYSSLLPHPFQRWRILDPLPRFWNPTRHSPCAYVCLGSNQADATAICWPLGAIKPQNATTATTTSTQRSKINK